MQMIFIQLSSPGRAPLRSLLIRYYVTSSHVFIAVNVAVYIIWMAPKWEHAENLIRWLVVEKQILMCCKTSHITRFLISDHVTQKRGWCNSQTEHQFSCSEHLVLFSSLNIRNMTIRHISKCFSHTFTLCKIWVRIIRKLFVVNLVLMLLNCKRWDSYVLVRKRSLLAVLLFELAPWSSLAGCCHTGPWPATFGSRSSSRFCQIALGRSVYIHIDTLFWSLSYKSV